ncbi:phage integrase Arm DNA-binding domain-containing protein [Proteus myxofaciens]|uniref:phage integrase Arm DNA-binding domain-containing protein n=1 Tax=Proteus myxofaciens TaxID=184072 RepID=UPI000A00BC05|nr:phage integrase Arm DNA-binding domain-containing protein [Proteus myxofaciens]
MEIKASKNNVNISNTYPLFSRKANKIYWRYRHPVTSQYNVFSDNETEAKTIVIKANTRLAEQRS